MDYVMLRMNARDQFLNCSGCPIWVSKEDGTKFSSLEEAREKSNLMYMNILSSVNYEMDKIMTLEFVYFKNDMIVKTSRYFS